MSVYRDTRAEFETWWNNDEEPRNDYSKKQNAFDAWNHRQVKIDKLKQQRDDLLVSAKMARIALAHADGKSPGLYAYEYTHLDKVIAKVDMV